ncbi:MAG: PIN/TRAM domain-containing protein, partial [Planctomycetota bacterium]|nr:PIN/TRAM domain-containing protein [Planctomycetota bacterium]
MPEQDQKSSEMERSEPKHIAAHDVDRDDSSFGQPFILITVRMIYIALMIAVAVLPFAGIIGATYLPHQGLNILAPIIATIAVATIIVLLDLKTPRKQLSIVVAIYLAILAGLLAAIAIGALIDLIADAWGLPEGDMALKYLTLLKLATGLTFCYLAVSMVLTTRDNIRLVIPYVEFSKQVRGIRPMLLDTSVLIDGRINTFSRTGFLDAPLFVPRFVIDELHRLSDSSDRMKRDRGRRGLANLRTLQDTPSAAVSIEEADAEEGMVDQALLDVAARQDLRLVTTDQTLLRVAEIRQVATLNLNDLSSMLQGQVLPGERMLIDII